MRIALLVVALCVSVQVVIAAPWLEENFTSYTVTTDADMTNSYLANPN
jgi:hypothetical protein